MMPLLLGVLSYNIGPGAVKRVRCIENLKLATETFSSPTPPIAATRAGSTSSSTNAALLK